jgi:hypothetical protein
MKRATSLDQSKELVKLGLDPNTADMCYTNHLYGSMRSSMRLSAYSIEEYKSLLKSFADLGFGEVFEPAWSLGALLKLMPSYHGYYPRLARSPRHGSDYFIHYPLKFNEIKESKAFEDPIDAAVDMLKDLLNNHKL